MPSPVTRLFRLIRLLRVRRNAQNSVNGAPTNLRPGELAFGDNESALYVGKNDGSVVTFGTGGGGGGSGVVVAGAGANSVVGLPANGNVASGAYSVIVGGIDNTASGEFSFIGGGGWDAETNTGGNTASGTYATIVGGWQNRATAFAAFIGGGGDNTASGNYSVVGGGESNTANSNYSVIGGGNDNTASGAVSAILGGQNNTASGAYSVAGGGRNNTASDYYSAVVGGYGNTATGIGAAVINGYENTASGQYSFIGNGFDNTASGQYSSILGGRHNDTNEYANAHILGSRITAMSPDSTFVNNLAVMGAWDATLNEGAGGLLGGAIRLPNGTQITVGSFDNMTSGANGLSLHCTVGYELNWQGGHLRSSVSGDADGTPINIYVDSPLEFPGEGTDNMQIDATGLTFPDGTTMTTAASGTGGGSTTVVALTFAAPLATDASAGDIFNVTLTGNTTLANPTNPADGKTLRWRISQDSTGGRTVSLGNKFTLPGSASPLAWSTDPNKMDVLAATYHAGRDKWDIVAFVPGY